MADALSPRDSGCGMLVTASRPLSLRCRLGFRLEAEVRKERLRGILVRVRIQRTANRTATLSPHKSVDHGRLHIGSANPASLGGHPAGTIELTAGFRRNDSNRRKGVSHTPCS